MKSKKQLAILFTLLLSITITLFISSLCIGQIHVSFTELSNLIVGQSHHRVQQIIMGIRLPRLIVCLLAGASLALSGTLLQTLTRNPLADSGILGINAGAGMMVAIVIANFSLQTTWVISSLSFFAVLGGFLTVFLVYFVAKDPHGGMNPVRLVIAGVGLSTLLSSTMIYIVSHTDRFKINALLSWLSGNINGDSWSVLQIITPLLLMLWITTYSLRYQLNILNLNEQTAKGLGLNIARTRIITLLLSTALAALSVIIAGNIMFIGLIAGHLAKQFIGRNHSIFLPAAMLLGAILLISADTITRVWLIGTSIPTGLVVSVLGAPYFLYIMTRLKS